MSITQTFYLAHKARGKLSSEAARQDHNLRLLVAHANLLDTLMVHLSDAEEQQEQWFNNTIRGNEESREWEIDGGYGSLPTDYDSESDSESESDDDVEIDYEFSSRPIPLPSNETVIGVTEVDEDEEFLDEETEDDEDSEKEDEDENGFFSLRRTTSHRPPSLCSDLSDDEDEESNPPSPPQPTMDYHLSEKERIENATRSFFDTRHSIPSSAIHHAPHDLVMEEDYFLPDRPAATMISTY